MKKTICIVLLMAIATSSFSQDSNFPPVVKDKRYYKGSSQEQLILGCIFLGAGITMLTIASTGNVDFDTLGALIIGGGLSTLGSIPLFIAAAKNKRRAKAANASLKMEMMPVVQQYSFTQHSFPVVSIKINL